MREFYKKKSLCQQTHNLGDIDKFSQTIHIAKVIHFSKAKNKKSSHSIKDKKIVLIIRYRPRKKAKGSTGECYHTFYFFLFFFFLMFQEF